jgi:hypothetical protein
MLSYTFRSLHQALEDVDTDVTIVVVANQPLRIFVRSFMPWLISPTSQFGQSGCNSGPAWILGGVCPELQPARPVLEE